MEDDLYVINAKAMIITSLIKGEEPLPEDCSVTPEDFVEIVGEMDSESLIENAKYSRDGEGKMPVASLNQAKVTDTGIQYIKDLPKRFGV